MLSVIDTATSQRDLDFGLAFREGWRDGYVKMGGDNVDTYVAPWYRSQVDRGRAAGWGHVGHYWVPDGNPDDPDLIDTPTQQADYMIDRLHDWRRASDFIVLDNEPLDGAWMLTDLGAAEFIERHKSRLLIPGRQCVMYGGWYDLAGRQWPNVLATGAMFLVADYRTSSQPGMNFPDIPTIPRDRIIGHQYGQKAIGGVVTDVNAFVDHAFDYGGAIVATETSIREWISGYQRSWDQLCQALMWQLAARFGTVVSTPVSAILAYHVEKSAGRINPGTPPPGSFVYWDIGQFGHVGFVMNGGRVLMATRHLAEELVSSDAGWQTVAGYTAATGADYLGWSYQNGGNTVPFSTSSTAGGGYTPIEEDDMFENGDRNLLIETRNLLREQQARNADPRHGVPGAIAAAVLGAIVSEETGTLAQTTRDARQAARRTEVKVEALAAVVAALSISEGIDPATLQGIVDTAVNAAVDREVEEVKAAVADIDDQVVQALQPLLNSGASADEIVAAIKAQWAK